MWNIGRTRSCLRALTSIRVHMSDVSFDATVYQESRSATISVIPQGYVLRTDVGAPRFRGFSHAVVEARDYLGLFLATADRTNGPM
jgi:hypothetical protein